jgi:hypothetical protein
MILVQNMLQVLLTSGFFTLSNSMLNPAVSSLISTGIFAERRSAHPTGSRLTEERALLLYFTRYLRNRRLLLTTKTLLNAIAPAASIGFR